MKKITTFAVLALSAISASAATINWGFGGNTWVSEDGTTSKLAANFTGDKPAGYLALVYLGQYVTTISDAVLSGLSENDVVTGAKAEYKMGTGRNASVWQIDNPSATVSSSTYSIGASFAVLYYNGAKFDYIYAANTTSGAVGSAFTGNTLTLTDVSDNAQAVSIYATRTGGTTAVAGAIHAVPEPSTAMLALAGLALLIKRRRA